MHTVETSVADNKESKKGLSPRETLEIVQIRRILVTVALLEGLNLRGGSSGMWIM
jgi:hypothetical protein